MGVQGDGAESANAGPLLWCFAARHATKGPSAPETLGGDGLGGGGPGGDGLGGDGLGGKGLGGGGVGKVIGGLGGEFPGGLGGGGTGVGVPDELYMAISVVPVHAPDAQLWRTYAETGAPRLNHA
jgi:hypothetical protein